MKNILLTISTVVLLLAGQSAMALNEDSSGFELITGNPNSDATYAYSQPDLKLEVPRASFIEQSDKIDNLHQMEAVDYLKAENTHQ